MIAADLMDGSEGGQLFVASGLPEHTANSVLYACKVALLRRSSDSSPDWVEIDVHTACQDGSGVLEPLTLEPPLPETARNVILGVRAASDVFIQTPVEPTHTGEALTVSGNKLWVGCDRSELFVRWFGCFAFYEALGEKRTPPSRHFGICPSPHDIGPRLQHRMQVIHHDRVSDELYGKDFKEDRQS